MIKTEANDFKVGLFILAGIGVLVAGLLGFGGAHFFERTIREETYVSENVNGLVIGAPVALRGVRVGKVIKIDFSVNEHPEVTPGFVRIEFTVLARVYPKRSSVSLAQLVQAQVNQGLRARVQNEGLVGSTILSLDYLNPAENPPPKVPWTPQYIYIPSAPSQMNQLFSSLELSLRKFSELDFQKLSDSMQRDLLAVN